MFRDVRFSYAREDGVGMENGGCCGCLSRTASDYRPVIAIHMAIRVEVKKKDGEEEGPQLHAAVFTVRANSAAWMHCGGCCN